MSSSNIIDELFQIIENRKTAAPDQSYVASLFKKGTDKINEKIMEEASEVCEASQENDKSHLLHEICDLLFHTFVLAGHKGISYLEIREELFRRFGTSGHVEKANRK